MAKTYRSQSARDAQAQGYGDGSYWAMLDDAAERHAVYFTARGESGTAARMFTQSLFEALAGNDGD